MSGTAQMEIHRVYLKDASFESSQQARSAATQWKPHLDINLNTSHRALEDQHTYEVVLHVTITAKQEEDIAFVVEVQQAGVFKLTDVEETQTPIVVQTHCANVLFPFAREAVADLVVKGGFPQLLLGPMDFQSLYQQKIKAMQEQQASTLTH